jgi:hypothetical protein
MSDKNVSYVDYNCYHDARKLMRQSVRHSVTVNCKWRKHSIRVKDKYGVIHEWDPTSFVTNACYVPGGDRLAVMQLLAVVISVLVA